MDESRQITWIIEDDKKQEFSEEEQKLICANPFQSKFSVGTMIKKYREVLDTCGMINTITFKEDLSRVLDMIHDDLAPDDAKLILGEWLYRKIVVFYRPKKPEEVTNVCDGLKGPITRARNIVLKGLYIHYNNLIALRTLTEYFFLNRFPEDEYFILQMLNDVQLIQTTPYNEILSHFIRWINSTQNYDQQCNLLDVLLRHFHNEPEVMAIYEHMRGDSSKRNIYTDLQNAHDEDITANTIKVVHKLMTWYKENPFDAEPEGEELFVEKSAIDMALEDLQKIGKPRLFEEILVRAKIDNTLFDGFSIMQVFIALCRYITCSPHATELVKRLEEEFAEMNGLCSSGYINRFINTLQGFDDEYSVKIPFKKQLHAVLLARIQEMINDADENVILGTYDPEYRRDYLDFITMVVNINFESICEQYGREDTIENLSETVKLIIQGNETVTLYGKRLSISTV